MLRPKEPRNLQVDARASASLLAVVYWSVVAWALEPQARARASPSASSPRSSSCSRWRYPARRPRARPARHAPSWLQAHVYLGVVAFVCRAASTPGFALAATGALGWCAARCSRAWTTASGLLGVWLQKWIPAALAEGLQVEALYERIPELVERLLGGSGRAWWRTRATCSTRFYRQEVRDALAQRRAVVGLSSSTCGAAASARSSRSGAWRGSWTQRGQGEGRGPHEHLHREAGAGRAVQPAGRAAPLAVAARAARGPADGAPRRPRLRLDLVLMARGVQLGHAGAQPRTTRRCAPKWGFLGPALVLGAGRPRRCCSCSGRRAARGRVAPGAVTSPHAPFEAALRGVPHAARGRRRRALPALPRPVGRRAAHERGPRPLRQRRPEEGGGGAEPWTARGCHVDHRGRGARLAAVDQRQCDAAATSGASSGHPEFAVLRENARDEPRHPVPARASTCAELAKQNVAEKDSCVQAATSPPARAATCSRSPSTATAPPATRRTARWAVEPIPLADVVAPEPLMARGQVNFSLEEFEDEPRPHREDGRCATRTTGSCSTCGKLRRRAGRRGLRRRARRAPGAREASSRGGWPSPRRSPASTRRRSRRGRPRSRRRSRGSKRASPARRRRRRRPPAARSAATRSCAAAAATGDAAAAADAVAAARGAARAPGRRPGQPPLPLADEPRRGGRRSSALLDAVEAADPALQDARRGPAAAADGARPGRARGRAAGARAGPARAPSGARARRAGAAAGGSAPAVGGAAGGRAARDPGRARRSPSAAPRASGRRAPSAPPSPRARRERAARGAGRADRGLPEVPLVDGPAPACPCAPRPVLVRARFVHAPHLLQADCARCHAGDREEQGSRRDLNFSGVAELPRVPPPARRAARTACPATATIREALLLMNGQLLCRMRAGVTLSFKLREEEAVLGRDQASRSRCPSKASRAGTPGSPGTARATGSRT